MKFAKAVLCGSIAIVWAGPAYAGPAGGDKVYGATVEEGVAEIETRYGQVDGGADNGANVFVLEAAYGFTPRFYGGIVAEFVDGPGSGRELEAIAVEGIYSIGKIQSLGIDVAVYGEYEAALEGPDKVEAKLLLQRARGRFDTRLNLVAEKEFTASPIAFEYAASADYAVIGDFRLGAVALGELGSSRKFLTRADHFLGPVAKFEIEGLPGKGELELEGGYLYAIGAARDEADGQFRLLIDYEFRF
ncbi:MAG: hypothetical protein GW859_07175 [Sphingomonadales bacterium]|jgi:hypothetical protein|nr:hypothetical protein [Sphingomonadales bacterium]